jgi:hypothetical protein
MKKFVFNDNFYFGLAIQQLSFCEIYSRAHITYTDLTVRLSNPDDIKTFMNVLKLNDIYYTIWNQNKNLQEYRI